MNQASGDASKSGDTMGSNSGVRLLSDREVAEAIENSPFNQALARGFENAFTELRLELAEVLHDMENHDDDEEPTLVVSEDERAFWKRMG
jgi:hypothetical protein